jgi:hypothetical protein
LRSHLSGELTHLFSQLFPQFADFHPITIASSA